MKPRTSIFLRSYAADLPWVPYALRSIQKFVSDIDEIVVSVPHEDYENFKLLDLTRERIVISYVSTNAMDPYLGQQYDKLLADQYAGGADYILYWDSDVIATRPFSRSDLMSDGKPRCLMTPYDKLVNPDGSPATPWKPFVEKALGHTVTHEFMRQHPFIVPRNALIGLRDYMEEKHKCLLGTYIASQPRRAFSEFNILHAWAYHHRPDLFSWWDTEVQGVPKPYVKQHWSYSGLTEAERAEMERILT